MKVLVHYQPKNAIADTFEGYRLRKTIKGACEASDITWVDSFSADPDVAHFLSPIDLPLVYKAKENKIKVVVSALYCESDPYAAFLNRKKEKLSKKAMKMLNLADLVLVPSEKMKELCLDNGVASKVEVCYPSVNLSRYENASIEKEIFLRYYRIKPNDTYAVCVGGYRDDPLIKRLRKIASSCPEIKFYYFGPRKHRNFQFFWKSHYERKSPKNLIFQPITEDDVYRSAIMNADAYLLLKQHSPDAMGLLDAFAAKTAVIALGEAKDNPLLKDGVNCRVCSSEEEVSKALHDVYHGTNKMTIIAGYKAAKERSLEILGKELESLYGSLIK